MTADRTLPAALCALVAMTLLGSLATADAFAKPKAKTPKTAQFKATIKGNQVITWSYHRGASRCVGSQVANGSTEMRFNSRKAGTIRAVEGRKGTPFRGMNRGRPVMTSEFAGTIFAEREGESSVSQPPASDNCEDNGGGVIPQPKDCGTRGSAIDFSLSYVNKNKLLVKGDAWGWGAAAVRTKGTGTELRNAFLNCPSWVNGPYTHAVAEGDLATADEPLKESTLFNSKRKKIVIHGSEIECYEASGYTMCGAEEGNFRGKVINTWTLTLKRVKYKAPSLKEILKRATPAAP